MNKLWFCILVGALIGCHARPDVEIPKVSAAPGLYDVHTGEPVSEVEAVAVWARARAVLIGESHTSADDHAVQLKVLELLAARQPNFAVGMEMFQRPFQPALDRYIAGDIDEAQMLLDTEWKERWGFETELYRPFWQLAQEHGRPLLALNIRREITKRIAKVGVDGLTPAETASLPEMDLQDTRYLEWMDEVFRSHGSQMESQKLERFFAAQVAWDETMADTAAKWALANPDGLVVVIAGRGHIERDWGIPSRLRRGLGAQYGDGAVISISPVASEDVPRWDWASRNRFADFVWVY